MADRPILLFPNSTKVSYSSKSGFSNKDLVRPTKLVQNRRIEEMFKRVTSAFELQRVELQQSADNVPPEMVLVFETRGSIDEFFKAIRRIPELKYLGDFEQDFDATPDFKISTDENKQVSGKLYCILANNMALNELRSLWKTWQTKKERFKGGETKWKHLFNLLYDIRIWSTKDRIEETGIMLDWEERVSMNEQNIPFEIELWFRKSKGQRKIDSDRIRTLVKEFNGNVVSEFVLEEINYHGMLIEAPINIFSNVLDDDAVRLFKAHQVMFVRPVGQNIGFNEVEIAANDPFQHHKDIQLPPVIALLDGVPMENHSYLTERLSVLDSDNFSANYPAEARRHGTAMASLIIHGDLNKQSNPLKSTLLVRPVMQCLYSFGETFECIPENLLIIDLIHRAVKEIMEHEHLGKTVKVFNISLGDSNRIFDNSMSSWAKLLDWLSDKYNILFVVSAGNISDEISLENLPETLAGLIDDPSILEKEFFKYAYSKSRFRRIIAPAESINSLTVGSSHGDSCENINLHDRIELHTNQSLSSPISRMGLGYKKSIKPEILADGGRILFRQSIVDRNVLSVLCKDSGIPPGIKTASPVKGLNSTVFTKGTSNSAALVSHGIGKLYEDFLSSDELRNIIEEDYFPVAAKALMVHSASWNKTAFENFQGTFNTPENIRDAYSRFLGYGKINFERIIECTEKRVTLIGYGKLKPESASLYELPLPNSLSGKVLWKKVIATLAWITPVNCDNVAYRTNKLWFEFQGKELEEKLKANRQFYNDDTVRRGTVQHEIFYGKQATAFTDSSLHIKVNCKTDAVKYDQLTAREQKDFKSIRYAIIVTLEVDPEFQDDIYNEIKLRIRPQVQVKS